MMGSFLQVKNKRENIRIRKIMNKMPHSHIIIKLTGEDIHQN